MAFRVARVVMTGAGRIDDNGAASHIRVHPLLAGLHDYRDTGLSILRTFCRVAFGNRHNQEQGNGPVPFPGKEPAMI
jgi:hypothetical protein